MNILIQKPQEHTSILEEFPELKERRELQFLHPIEFNVNLNSYYSRMEPQNLLLAIFKCLITFRNQKIVFGLKFNSNLNKVPIVFCLYLFKRLYFEMNKNENY